MSINEIETRILEDWYHLTYVIDNAIVEYVGFKVHSSEEFVKWANETV